MLFLVVDVASSSAERAGKKMANPEGESVAEMPDSRLFSAFPQRTQRLRVIFSLFSPKWVPCPCTQSVPQRLNNHPDPLPSADAGRRQPISQSIPLQLIQNRNDQPRSRSS
jgi:hypothetical protein